MELNMTESVVLRDVAMCSVVVGVRRFGGPCCSTENHALWFSGLQPM
jgi:hypothetical protein